MSCGDIYEQILKTSICVLACLRGHSSLKGFLGYVHCDKPEEEGSDQNYKLGSNFYAIFAFVGDLEGGA